MWGETFSLLHSYCCTVREGVKWNKSGSCNHRGLPIERSLFYPEPARSLVSLSVVCIPSLVHDCSVELMDHCAYPIQTGDRDELAATSARRSLPWWLAKRLAGAPHKYKYCSLALWLFLLPSQTSSFNFKIAFWMNCTISLPNSVTINTLPPLFHCPVCKYTINCLIRGSMRLY